MSTFVLIHGGGHVGWSWHLVPNSCAATGTMSWRWSLG
jgi:hypothetical protein